MKANDEGRLLAASQTQGGQKQPHFPPSTLVLNWQNKEPGNAPVTRCVRMDVCFEHEAHLPAKARNWCQRHIRVHGL